MVEHVLDLLPGQRRELLGLLTQERTDLQTDQEVLSELSETLRRQLSLSAATDLAEGFRRRMIRIADELGGGHTPGRYDFISDRVIAEEILTLVGERAGVLSSDADDAFKVDFAKGFRTMSQEKRATWLRDAALARSAAESGEVDTQRAADAAKRKSSAEETAEHIAADVWVVEDLYRAARKAGVPRLTAAAAPLGLVAGGAVAFAIRQRRKAAQQKARDAAADVQVRRDRQATQAVVTTCAYLFAEVQVA